MPVEVIAGPAVQVEVVGSPARVVGVPVVVGPAGPPGDATTAVAEHLADLTPHPVYDDLPSLVLLFENGLI